MATALEAMPAKVTAGNYLRYTKALSDYPAPTWTMKLWLVGAKVVSKDAVQSGSSFQITLLPADTDSELTPGVYRWVERVSNAATGEVYDAASGVVEVLPDVAQATPYAAATSTTAAVAGSQQSLAEFHLGIVNDQLGGRLSADMQAYEIAGRRVDMIPYLELKRIQADLRTEVWREKNPDKLGRQVLVSFTSGLQ